MPNSQSFVDFVLDQAADAGDVSYRPMFGGGALYCDGRVAALICDDRLYVKDTGPGRAWAAGQAPDGGGPMPSAHSLPAGSPG